jgi:hypothetical protein
MQPSSVPIIIGYKYRVGIRELLENKYSYEDKKTRFLLKSAVRKADFIPSMEVAPGSPRRPGVKSWTAECQRERKRLGRLSKNVDPKKIAALRAPAPHFHDQSLEQ